MLIRSEKVRVSHIFRERICNFFVKNSTLWSSFGFYFDSQEKRISFMQFKSNPCKVLAGSIMYNEGTFNWGLIHKWVQLPPETTKQVNLCLSIPSQKIIIFIILEIIFKENFSSCQRVRKLLFSGKIIQSS